MSSRCFKAVKRRMETEANKTKTKNLDVLRFDRRREAKKQRRRVIDRQEIYKWTAGKRDGKVTDGDRWGRWTGWGEKETKSV